MESIINSLENLSNEKLNKYIEETQNIPEFDTTDIFNNTNEFRKYIEKNELFIEAIDILKNVFSDLEIYYPNSNDLITNEIYKYKMPEYNNINKDYSETMRGDTTHFEFLKFNDHLNERIGLTSKTYEIKCNYNCLLKFSPWNGYTRSGFHFRILDYKSKKETYLCFYKNSHYNSSQFKNIDKYNITTYTNSSSHKSFSTNCKQTIIDYIKKETNTIKKQIHPSVYLDYLIKRPVNEIEQYFNKIDNFKLTQLQEEHTNLNNKITYKSNKLDQQYSIIEQNNKEIKDHKESINNLEKSLILQNQEINTLKESNTDLTNTIDNLTANINNLNNNINNLKNENNDLISEINNLQNNIVDKDLEISKLNKQLKDITKLYEILKNRINN